MKTKIIHILSLFVMLSLITGISAQGPPDDSPSFPVEFGTPVTIQPGEYVELVTPNGISITVMPGESVEINITEYSTNPTGNNPEGGTAIDIFVDIEMNESTTVDANIAIPYGDHEEDVNNPQNLELNFYNPSSGQWESVESTVDENAQIVSANVDHFSLWTVVETNVDGFLNFPLLALFTAIIAIPIVRRKLQN